MRHEVLREHLIAVSAVLALLVLVHRLFGGFAGGGRLVLPEHRNGFDIDLFGGVAEHEAPGIDVPPVATLVFNKVSNKLVEVDLQLSQQVSPDVFDVADRLFEESAVCRSVDGASFPSFRHRRILELNGHLRIPIGELRVGGDDPALRVLILPPYRPHNVGLVAVALYKSLEHVDLTTCAADPQDVLFQFASADESHFVALQSFAAVASLQYRQTLPS